MRSTVVKTDVPGERLPWKLIGVAGGVGATLGIVSVVTSAGLDTLPTVIASLLDVAMGVAILAGLWAATFFTPDH